MLRYQEIALVILTHGEPMDVEHIVNAMAEHGWPISALSATTILNTHPEIFYALKAGSFQHSVAALWSTHQLEAARLRVLYGEKPVVRGVKDVREMVRRAG